MIIVDTFVWIDFLNGATNPETEWLDLNLKQERIGVLTATSYIREQHALLHRDPEFDIFEARLGLQVIQP